MKRMACLLFAAFMVTGCTGSLFTDPTEPNFLVRMKSTYPATVYNVKIGTVDFGTVLQNSTSDYKQIEAGSHKITGNTSAGQQLTGTLSVSGKGTHKFTVNLSSAGELSVSED